MKNAQPPLFSQTVTVDSMVKVVFTGDSQTAGRNLAIDYPQLISRRAPVRVINTAVGGSNSDALVKPMTGGTVRLKKGDRVLYGEDVRWGMGPYPGMKVTVHGETYTIDHVVEHPKRKPDEPLRTEIHLVESARANYEGTDYTIEPGWEVRVARHHPDVVCLMFINDGGMPPDKRENWREMIRRIRGLGAAPILMSPVPVDHAGLGGNHPGDNIKFAENAQAVRELAQEHGCWFVDVFHLFHALDPPFRGVIRDGIHPDTDGQTCIVNGLLWVFEQMGLMDARPFIKGWVLLGPEGPLPELLRGGARPFTISQPDHPDPDHQSEAGFTLAAIQRNDEYGLIASQDGANLPVGHGVLLQFGLAKGVEPRSVAIRLAGDGITRVHLWRNGWSPLELKEAGGWLRGIVPIGAMQDSMFFILVSGVQEAQLDAVAADTYYAERLPLRWRPPGVTPSPYTLASDHLRPDNLVQNPDFRSSTVEPADFWELLGQAWVNRPSRRPVEKIGFMEESDLYLVEFEARGPVRPYDLIEVMGSARGNNGVYRIRESGEGGRWRLRRPAKAVESELRGELIHNDGCGLVAGDCCVEVSGNGAARQCVPIPKETRTLRLSFFYRVYDPKALGTRDVPEPSALIRMIFYAAGHRPIGQPKELAGLPCSYQWQKGEAEISVPAGTESVELLALTATGAAVQYTGFYLGRDFSTR